MEPWFERRGLIGYQPIHQKGRVLLLFVSIGFFGFAAASLYFTDNSPLSMTFAAAAFLIGIIGHIFVYRHMVESDRHKP
jgi:hypothetical protein